MTENLEPDLFTSLSERLRAGHRQVAALSVDAEQKARAARRLIAITDAAKHNMQRASERLDVFLADLAAGRIAASDD